MKITWLGHSCFKVESDGYSAVLDPYADGSVPGLGDVRETADIVLCSHGHDDHNAAGNVNLRGSGAAPYCLALARLFDGKSCVVHEDGGYVHGQGPECPQGSGVQYRLFL